MRAAPIPKTVRVGPHAYSVLLTAAAQMPKTQGRPDCGTCRFDSLQILVKKRQRRTKQQETLLHEVLHSCTYPNLIGKKVTDEDFVETTAPLLLQVLKDNPKLLAYLTQ